MYNLDLITKAALPIAKFKDDMESFHNFSQDFDNWIFKSNFKVQGLPKDSYIVSGITDAFNQTYAIYNKIGIFEGEYPYHEVVLPKKRLTKNLKAADCIIVSHPFSADGMSAHEKLAYADTFNKPIFVDCAFFGICSNVNFDFTLYKNIHTVAFSLSKTFGTGYYRVGKIYTVDTYPVSVYKEWDYQLLSSAKIHYDLINTLGPDDTFKKYRQKQIEICNELGIIPSDTVIFGLDHNKKYNKFKRGYVNRLCITHYLK
jgi:hypothetical protein